MPRIIFKCRYLKNASVHLSNMVEYVATREGVEITPDSRGLLPATKKQRQIITDILQKFPDTADLFEYEDYLKEQTRENASEFISMAVEQNFDLLGKRKNYVGYIASRPRVETLGTHGLFTDAGVTVVLSRVAEEVGSHLGNVWTYVVSLRREDAARLGYDSAKAWRDLIRGQRNIIAEQMKITPENLRWYAAYHDEGHHPHIHLIVYSSNPKEAYVTKEAIKNMRGSLAREIFRQDLLQIYSEQTECRDTLTKQSWDAMKEIINQISSGVYENKTIEELISHLAERLKHTSGKKQYGYLKAPLKAVIDQIMDELAKDERVAECYEQWYKLRNEVLRTYADKLPPLIPLSRQKEFKSIKNMVIAEALHIGGGHFTFEPDEAAEASMDEIADGVDETDNVDLYRKSARQKNPYASYELAKMLRDGVGTEKDLKKADEHFHRAFTGFSELEADSRDDKLQYRLGHMLYTGIGTEKDIAAAIQYLAKAAKLGNIHAQYMLGKIYLDTGSGHENMEKALAWLAKAADNDNALAQYALGKLYRDGNHVGKDILKAVSLFTKSAEQGNQYAQYALGKLYLMGYDIPRDREAVLKWLAASAAQGNIYAQFFLDRMDSFRDPSVLLGATRLMHHLGNIFRDEHKRVGGSGTQVDRKLRKKLARKKSAQGHAYDDYAPQQSN